MADEIDDIFDDDIVDPDVDLDQDIDDDDEDSENEGEDDDNEDNEDTEEEIKSSQFRVIIIHKDKRITCNILNLYELAGVVGIRARYIENGDDYYVPSTGCINAIEIAEKEIAMGQSPMIVERHVKKTEDALYVEHWGVNELICDVNVLESGFKNDTSVVDGGYNKAIIHNYPHKK